MTNQDQAFIEGFVKRASEYGYSEFEAINLLKAADAVPPVAMPSRASLLGAKPQVPQVAPAVPQVNPAMMNEAIVQPNQRAYNQAPVIPATKPMRNEAIRQPNQRAYNQDPRTGRVLTPAQLDALND
jgi:hypothetical protein